MNILKMKFKKTILLTTSNRINYMNKLNKRLQKIYSKIYKTLLNKI